LFQDFIKKAIRSLNDADDTFVEQIGLSLAVQAAGKKQLPLSQKEPRIKALS
jgi:hypothetical protein